MRAHTGYEELKALLGSGARALILGRLAAGLREDFTASEMARETGLSTPEAARQLALLEGLGLLRSQKRGRLRLYRVEHNHPLWPELRMLAVKTLGPAGVVGEALAGLDLELAAIFGSVAQGTDTVQSDVDLLVIGKLSMPDLSPALDEAERRLGREVNAALYTPAGLREELRRGNAWLEAVLHGKMLYLKGDESVLRALAGTRADTTA